MLRGTKVVQAVSAAELRGLQSLLAHCRVADDLGMFRFDLPREAVTAATTTPRDALTESTAH